jgi:hypothetical protein
MLEHHGGEELCEHPCVAVNEGVLTVLDLEQGFSDADLYLKLLLFLLGESDGEEMHSPIFLALNIYLIFLTISIKNIPKYKINFVSKLLLFI